MVETLVPTFYQYWTNAVPICESTNGPIQSTNIWPILDLYMRAGWEVPLKEAFTCLCYWHRSGLQCSVGKEDS